MKKQYTALAMAVIAFMVLGAYPTLMAYDQVPIAMAPANQQLSVDVNSPATAIAAAAIINSAEVTATAQVPFATNPIARANVTNNQTATHAAVPINASALDPPAPPTALTSYVVTIACSHQ